MRAEPVRTEFTPPPEDDPGEPRLIALIRDEIERTGTITFARFMERALYEPGLGYYSTRSDRPTRSGDFVTAPELHPIFGHVVARDLDRMWQLLGQPDRFTVREYGAGRGTLERDIVDGLARVDSRLITALDYQPIENEAVQPPSSKPAGPFVGAVLANEFVDALPVHCVEMQGGQLKELFVGWSDGRFVNVLGEPSNERLAAWFEDGGISLADGQRAEVNLVMLDWMSDVAHDLERGFVLAIDYGASTAELVSPMRSLGTVRAFRGQHVSSDVLSGVGHQDLTAHVDFDALERAARAAGLIVVARTGQAEFLLSAGLEEVYAVARSEADTDWDAALTLRSAVRRLLDPAALGGYRVLTLSKGV